MKSRFKPQWYRVVMPLALAAAALILTHGLLRPSTRAEIQPSSSASELHVLRSDEKGIVLELSVSDAVFAPIRVNETQFEQIQVHGLSSSSEAGYPQLPKADALIGIPPDADITLQILSDGVTPVAGVHRLLPVPTAMPVGEYAQPGEVSYLTNRTAYASPELYPGKVAVVAETAWLRDQHLARIELFPFQYMPATGKVVQHRRLVVEVQFSFPKSQLKPAFQPVEPSAAGPFEPALQQLLLNYAVARQWRAKPLDAASLSPAVGASLPLTMTWYKIVTDHDGLYRITYADLKAAGLPVDSIDPRTFHLTNQGDEVAIEVSGEADGHFDPGDYLIFYGQKFYGDRLAAKYATESNNWLTFPNGWHPQYTPKWAERYTNHNVYWLTVNGTPGLRINGVNGLPSGTAPQPTYYTDTVHAEYSTVWQLTSFTGEDPFYWQRMRGIKTVTTSTYTTTLSAIAAAAVSATVRGEIVGVNQNPNVSPDHHTQFYINHAAMPFQDVYWDGVTRLRFGGQVAASDLVSGANWVKLVVYTTTALSATGDDIMFDWYEIDYPRQFQALGDQITFNGNQVGARQYRIGGFLTDTLWAYNVTNPLQPQRVSPISVTGATGTYTATFEVSHTMPVTYIVASLNALQSPQSITPYQPPDLLSNANSADYIIITPRAFYTSAQTLANYRAGQGLRVKVVDLSDVFNEFDDGIFNPIAIKNFLRYAYEHWQPPAPLYALLVGDGHWNLNYFPAFYTGTIYMPPDLAWVDPWQGEVDSANLLVDFVGTDSLPDMLIGRALVDSPQEMDTIVSKTIGYEQAGFQPWQKNHIFIADNVPDGAGDFVGLSNYAIQNLLPVQATPLRIYENDFGCSSANSPGCNNIRFAITNTLNLTGAFLMNYVGHGSVPSWSGESIFGNASLPTLSNARLPIILSWTCLDGYWSYASTSPSVASMIKNLVRAPNGGAVAAFSPTGLGVATGHDSLQRGFYNAIFREGAQRVGLAALGAKLALYATGSNYDLINTFTLYGDPALRLPTYSIAAAPLYNARSGATGTIVTYTFTVSNLSYLPDQITAQVTSTWPVTTPSVPIGPGQSASFMISVTVPLTALNNSQDVAAVKLQSIGDETRVTAVVTTTAIRYEGLKFRILLPIMTRSL